MVTGSRGWKNEAAIRDRLAALPADACVMQGGAAGADNIAYRFCLDKGLKYQTYRPAITRPSPQRYHERNDRMLDQADLVLAFWDGRSRGTGSVIEKAQRRGIPVEVISSRRTPTGDPGAR